MENDFTSPEEETAALAYEDAWLKLGYLKARQNDTPSGWRPLPADYPQNLGQAQANFDQARAAWLSTLGIEAS